MTVSELLCGTTGPRVEARWRRPRGWQLAGALSLLVAALAPVYSTVAVVVLAAYLLTGLQVELLGGGRRPITSHEISEWMAEDLLRAQEREAALLKAKAAKKAGR